MVVFTIKHTYISGLEVRIVHDWRTDLDKLASRVTTQKQCNSLHCTSTKPPALPQQDAWVSPTSVYSLASSRFHYFGVDRLDGQSLAIHMHTHMHLEYQRHH